MKHRPVSLLLYLAFFRVHLFLSPDLYLYIACKQGLVQTKRFEIRLSLLFSSFWPKCIHLHFKYWDNASEETSYILKAKETFMLFFSMNSNIECAKIDHKNDNNNNTDVTYEFKDPSGERSMPTTLSQPASKIVLPQTLKKQSPVAKHLQQVA